MSTSQSIFCVGVDHHATPLRIREILAASAPERWIPHLIEYRGADEVVFLSTCNRVEIYGKGERRGLEILSALAQAMPHELGKIGERLVESICMKEFLVGGILRRSLPGCVPWWWASPRS